MVTRFDKLVGYLALLYVSPGFAQAAPTEIDDGAHEFHAPTSQSDTSQAADPRQTATAAAPSDAASADVVEARSAFDEGLGLLRGQRWPEAEASFRRSLAHVPRPSTKYNLAFVLFKQDKLKESSELLQDLLSGDDAALDVRYRDYAKALLANVWAAVSVLHLVITPENAELRVDGQPVPIGGRERSVPLDPGTHQVLASAPGFVSLTTQIVIPARGEGQREIELQQLRPPEHAFASTASPKSVPTRSAWVSAGPWVTIGVGAGLLAAAVVTGVLAKEADSDFAQKCPTLDRCEPQLQRLGDKVSHLATATNILLASGAAFVVGGVTWRLVLPAHPTRDGQRSALLAASAHF
jgi:hypothetical protein